MRSLILVSLVSVLALSAGCSTQPESSASKKISAKHLAPAQIQSSFMTVEGPNNQQHITINRSSLGKAYLMTSSMVAATNTPILDHLLPKVVAFEENGDALALFELNIYQVYDELPSEKLLQTFPIISKSDESITFKMEMGFTAFSMKDGLGASDFPGSLSGMAAMKDPVTPSVTSFVRNAQFVGNQLEVIQTSRVRVTGLQGGLMTLLAGGDFETGDVSIHLTTRLQPYRLNETFERKLSTLQKGVGYFEVAAMRYNDGRLNALASRWDISPEKGPITYAISKNAPADLIDAIKEGVTYWNIVYGREVLKVETGAAPDEIPGYRRAMIRWIPWDGAGFARAAILPDPITGEILSADVYLTSAWNLYGQRSIPRKHAPDTQGKNAIRVMPTGFASATECGINDSHAGDATIDLLTASARKPELILKATQDMIRTVTAHEVGHTLGLRHNFAGSLGSELLTSTDHMIAWNGYLEDEKHPGAAVSTSVMDYMTTYDDYLVGAAIKSRPMTYDLAAIRWGYLDKGASAVDPATPAFCTDMEAHTSPSLGCALFDSSQNPMAAYADQAALAREKMADTIVDGLLSRVFAKYQQDRKSLDQAVAAMNPEALSASMNSYAVTAFDLMSKGSKALAVKEVMGETSWFNREEVTAMTPKVLSRYFEEAGGLPGWLKNALGGGTTDKLGVPQKGWLLQAVEQRLAEPDFAKGKTLDGVEYELNSDQVKVLSQAAALIAGKVEEYALRDLILAMTGKDPMALMSKQPEGIAALLSLFGSPTPTYERGLAQKHWKRELSGFTSDIITRALAIPLPGKKGKHEISVPDPAFPVATRLAAVRLLSDKTFQTEKWMNATQNRLEAEIKGRILVVANETQPGFWEGLLGAKPKISIEGLKLSPEIQKWVMNEMAVLSAIQEVDAGKGDDLLSKLLVASMLGISYEEAGVSEDVLIQSLQK